MYNINNLRKKEAAEHEEWQLTLADMMTLLLCFFVLIASISSVDMGRYKAISDIMGEAMKSKVAQDHEKKKNLKEFQNELESIIGPEIMGVQLELRSGAVAINLKGAILFNKGSAILTEEALSLLSKIAGSLLNIRYRIEVEGHSDNIPMKSGKFPSNWELSSARASAVARFFIDYGFPKNKIKVLGLADTMPLLPNEDEYGRPIPENQAQNRRVVILVSPLEG